MNHYTIGAALLRKRLKSLPMAERETLLKLLWPAMPLHHRHLFATYPDELQVNGSQLRHPQSWAAPVLRQ